MGGAHECKQGPFSPPGDAHDKRLYLCDSYYDENESNIFCKVTFSSAVLYNCSLLQYSLIAIHACQTEPHPLVSPSCEGVGIDLIRISRVGISRC